MCGIAGYYSPRKNEWQVALTSMTDALRHRGPDDAGYWADREAGIFLGHRRLSILDLSSEGHQPKISQNGRFVITFNGEIYNFLELRALLEEKGITFRGRGDTEVILAGFEAWGVVETVRRCVGMFAFAVWDAIDGTLSLFRDRLGERPLYYGWNHGNFLFASELKAIAHHPEVDLEIDQESAAAYFQYWCIPAPLSIFRGIFKLPPGCFLTLAHDQLHARPTDFSPDPDSELPCHHPLRYWSLAEVSENLLVFPGSLDDACSELEKLLSTSVKGQMLSDVPLGAFLSGGVDSSLIVALMQRQSTRPVRSFSIGFSEEAYNEAPFAKTMAGHLGTDHTELYLTPKDAMDVIPMIPSFFDEPFADSSQIPTYLVSKLARQHVTVSLSGDGGDELFGGYTKYQRSAEIWKIIEWIPSVLRKRVSGSRKFIPDRVIESLSVGRKIERALELCGAENQRQMYHSIMSLWLDAIKPKGGVSLPIRNLHRVPAHGDFLRDMMLIDLLTYLPDDILAKVDRSAMAVSLEARAPFLDHRVVEFALGVPTAMKIRGNDTKIILRKLLSKYVPPSLFERPKQGFSVPVAEWLRGPLREWAENLLSPSSMHDIDAVLDSNLVSRRWAEHLSGRRDWSAQMWTVLMYQAWRRDFVGKRTSRNEKDCYSVGISQ